MNRLTFDDNLTDLNKAIHILTKGKAMQKLAVIITLLIFLFFRFMQDWISFLTI